MRSFSDFQPEEKKGRDKVDLNDYLASFSRQYEGKSGDDVMRAILKEAEKGRANGTLTDKDIDEFSAMISPALNQEQNKMLEKIVKRLKKK